jgi:hypothetical protein
MNNTPEQIRFHAAGHVAAALLLVESGHAESASKIMQTVGAYVGHPKVQAPPQVVEKVAATALAPNSADLKILEQWFCDPLNTQIEKAG